MYLRFFGRLLDGTNAVIYAPPLPLDSGNLSLFLAALASDMTPGSSVLVNSFQVDDVYPDRYTRLAATSRTAADIGKLYQQQSDDSYWTLTAIGPPATYTAFVPVAPALPTGGAGTTGGGSGPAAAPITITLLSTNGGGDPSALSFNNAQYPPYTMPVSLHNAYGNNPSNGGATYTATVTTPGRYALSCDCIVNTPFSNSITATVGGVIGPVLSCALPVGGLQKAPLGTFAFVAGDNPIMFSNGLSGSSWGITTLYLTPA